MRIRNLRDGVWEIPDLRIDVGAEPFDVDDPAVARSLLEQEGNYAPVDSEAQAVADEIAAEREQHDTVAAADDVRELTAAELVASLDTLSHDELRDVRVKEQASTRPRKTVLNRIAELLGEEQEG